MPESNEPKPPPLPNRERPIEAEPHPEKSEFREAYDTLADVAGGVPSLRWKDNLYQAAAIAAFVLVGAVIGFAMVFVQSTGRHRMIESLMGAAAGGFVGLIAGVLLSGFVLAILGIKRVVKK